jgi:hypothetical protein
MTAAANSSNTELSRRGEMPRNHQEKGPVQLGLVRPLGLVLAPGQVGLVPAPGRRASGLTAQLKALDPSTKERKSFNAARSNTLLSP